MKRCATSAPNAAAVAFRSRHAPNASSRASASVSASGYDSRVEACGTSIASPSHQSIWPTNTRRRGGEKTVASAKIDAADATVAAVCKRIAATAADF